MSKGRLAALLVMWTVLLVGLMGAILFISAGTWQYWQAWVFLGVFFVLTLVGSLYFLVRSPALLERRMRWREPERQQEIGQRILGLLLFLGMVVAGLDHRYGWSHVPVPLVLIADVAIAAGFLFVYRVYQENEYASSTIEVEGGQQVISTGPYAIVRHPMYLGVLPIFLGIPLALGSYWALLVYLLLPIGLIRRILNEEQVLLRDLPGYEEYREKVKWRLVPGVW